MSTPLHNSFSSSLDKEFDKAFDEMFDRAFDEKFVSVFDELLEDYEQAYLDNSRLQLHVSSPSNDQNRNNQVFSTEQSPPPNSTEQITNGHQDSTVMMPVTNNNNNRKKLRVMVLPKCGTRKIPVDVNAGDNVGELRKELAKIQQRFQLSLPQEGYFFIYKQNVMDDDRSFRWHRVAHGDTIEIFIGSVSGGS